MQEDSDFIDRLRSGDEQAFRTFVAKLQPSLVSVAQTFVGNRATAEEVVQDTWLATIEGLSTFEGRSSLKNWVFAILANKARTRAVRDSRMVAAGSLSGDIEEDEPVVDQSRFDASGGWAQPPASWDHMTPERVVAGQQMWVQVEEAINKLPPPQRSVIVLRQVEEMESDEVQEILGITAANQRVLLHRARAKIREHVEQTLDGRAGQLRSTANLKGRTAQSAAT
jgi:RNA polymerase sigma-70 factor (ECF subfamily)